MTGPHRAPPAAAPAFAAPEGTAPASPAPGGTAPASPAAEGTAPGGFPRAVGADGRRVSPAVARNRDAILAVLRAVLPARGRVLEVASGGGEHAVHFAAALPGLAFLPSDPDPVARASIAAWARAAGLANLHPPLALDAAAADWPIAAADAVLCINMIHIAPWEAALGLLAGAARLLPAGAPLVLYGPYHRGGAPTAPSNAAFDESLRAQDPRWGVRDLEAVEAAAARAGFCAPEVTAMPANNLTLVFRRAGGG